jgi:hypothetical protein
VICRALADTLNKDFESVLLRFTLAYVFYAFAIYVSVDKQKLPIKDGKASFTGSYYTIFFARFSGHLIRIVPCFSPALAGFFTNSEKR